jgi:CHAD domain-containing protein
MIVQMKGSGKWVKQVEFDDSVHRAARLTLKPRLKAVQRFLKLAAKRWHQDVEYVHQLRVQTRRSLAALELYREVLPKRECKKLESCLNEIRKAAGRARDLDVFAEKFQIAGELERTIDPDDKHQQKTLARLQRTIRRDVAKRRRKAQRPIERLNRDLSAQGRFKQQARKLLKSLEQPAVDHNLSSQQGLNFGPWAQDRFSDAADRFLSASPRTGASLRELHRFRIQGKQLRYTMELVANVYDSGFRSDLYGWLTELQERLGMLTDHDQARRYLMKLASRTTKGLEAKIVKDLIAREQERFAVDRIEVQSWWKTDVEPQVKLLLQHYQSAYQPCGACSKQTE